jgi:hypothetical protein
MAAQNDDGELKLALEHARALFVYHAGQRIQSLNYYFVAIAVFLSGFGFLANSSLSNGKRALVGLVLSIAGIFLTVCFQGLDQRNDQLVERDESLLKWAEKEMADKLNCPAWKITEAAGDPAISKPARYRYKKIVPRIFGLYMALIAAGGIYAIWPWAARWLCCSCW